MLLRNILCHHFRRLLHHHYQRQIRATPVSYTHLYMVSFSNHKPNLIVILSQSNRAQNDDVKED